MFKGNGGFTGKSGITGRLSHTGIRSFSGLQNDSSNGFDPASLFQAGDKGVFFVQNQATMWSDFARTTPTVRNGGDPSGLVAVIDNMVDTGGIIEAPTSASRSLLVTDGLAFDYVDDSFTADMDTGAITSGSIVVATDRGTWFGEFETDAAGLLAEIGRRYAYSIKLVGVFLINRTITVAEKQKIKQFFITNGADKYPIEALHQMWGFSLTSIDVECLSDFENATSMGFMLRGNKFTSVPLFDTSNAAGMDRMLRDNNLTSVPLYSTINATNLDYMLFNNNLTATAINDFLLKMQSDNLANPRTNVDCRFMFLGGTNSSWASLSPAAQAAAQDLKDNYSWDFTSAFNGGGPA